MAVKTVTVPSTDQWLQVAGTSPAVTGKVLGVSLEPETDRVFVVLQEKDATTKKITPHTYDYADLEEVTA